MAEIDLRPGALWDQMLPALERLPDGPLPREAVVSAEFLLAEENQLSVYWVPFERLNPRAEVILLGLTPGYSQMQEAFAAARDALRSGATTAGILSAVDRRASFAGAMRANMVRMLDAIGLARALDVASAAELFENAETLSTQPPRFGTRSSFATRTMAARIQRCSGASFCLATFMISWDRSSRQSPTP